MAKKLLLKVFTFWALILTPVVGWGQCPYSPTNPATASITLQGSNNICSDESISITSSNIEINDGSNESYQWQVQVGSGSWTDLAGETSTDLTDYTDVQNNSKFRLAIIFCVDDTANKDTYYSNISSTVTVNQVTTATATISANRTEICPNESINFSASLTNQGGSPTYSWRVNGVERGTSSSFSWNQFNNGDSVDLWMTSSKACANDGDADANDIVESNLINISVKPAIPDTPGDISGPGDFCPNSSGATYSITEVDRATSYIWTLPAGWSGSSTTNSIDITTGAAGTDQVISVRAVNECGESAENTFSVNVGPGTPSTPSAITGAPALICEGDGFTLSVTDDPEMNYTWTVPTGWSITDGQGFSTIDVTAGNYGENGTVSVFATNSCNLNSDTQSINLSINDPIPSTPGTISGNSLVCPETDFNYSIEAVQFADSYEWILDGNTMSGATGTSFTFNSTTVGDHTLEVIAINECGSSLASSKTITVDDGPPDATSISVLNSEVNFCPGQTGITFSVQSDPKIDIYTWEVPDGWSVTAGAGTNEINLTAGQLGNDGQIRFTGSSNDCGLVTATYDVYIKNPAPVITTETISGEIEVCHNSTGLTYSIPAIQYATNYIWSVPDNWGPISGNGTNTITVDAGSDDGYVTVIAENDCGQSTTLNLSVQSIDAVPPQPDSISSNLWDSATNSNTPICPPASGITFSIDPVTGADSYNWILPTGWEFTSGEGTESITVTVTASADYATNESISVEAVNICGNGSSKSYDNITLSDYVVTNAGPDQTVCKTTSPVTISGNVDFNGSKMKILASSSGTGTFSNIPNGKVDVYSITYTPSQADINNLSQVIVTITTEAPVGACGPGEDEMIINFRPDPTATISPVIEICEGQSANVSFTGTPNTTLTYQVNSGSNQTVNLDASGNASISTATLSTDANISITNIVYQDAPNCSISLSESATITVNPIPSVEIAYTNLCSSQTDPVAPSFSNGVGAWETGTFSATGDLGANINADGSFIPANITPGTYTVTYTITGSGGCADVPVTTNVTIFEEVIITSQPESDRICEGLDAQFEVLATGEGLTYQWYKGDTNAGSEVANGTSSILNLPGVIAADAGDYIVVVSGTSTCSPVISLTASLDVDQNMVIDTQPTSITVCESETTSLSVAASVGGSSIDNTYSYQWYKGTPGSGDPITGANSSSLPLNNVIPSDSGDYYVEITGPESYTCNTITSDVAVVEVKPTPTVEILGTTTICEGEETTLSFVNGTPNAVVTYVLNNNNPTPQNITLDANGEATLNTGALVSTSDSDTNFEYQLQSVAYAEDPFCSVSLSGSAIVTVAPNPEVSISFAGDQTEFCTADGNSYTPSLDGTGTFNGGTYSSTGLDIDPATGAFTPGNEIAGAYTITYTIPAYGGCPEETTSLEISIYEEVNITSQPSNLGICSTSDAEFSVTATGDNLTYQWFKVVGEADISTGVTENDDTPVPGGTSASLSLPVATSEDAGPYYVKVAGTNACTPTEDTRIASDVVTLNVDEDIVIIEPAQDVRACNNTNATVTFKFVAHANGSPLSFEWIYADGSPVNPDTKVNMDAPAPIERDATAEEIADHPELANFKVYEGTLTINNITTSDQASYAVRIDGSANNFTCPEAVSNSFNLDVDPLPDAPSVTSLVEYCIGDTTAVPLTATPVEGATLTWYDSLGNELTEAPTPSTENSGDTSYFVSQKDAYCEGAQAEIVVRVHDLPSAPPLTAEELNVEYCLGATASTLIATAFADHTILWYDSESATEPLNAAPTPQTTSAGTIDYWVSQKNNSTTCESERVQIIVTINDLPNITITNSGNETICQGDLVTLTATDANDIDSSTTYSWDWTDNTGEALAGSVQDFSPTETTTYTVTATSSSGCINTKSYTINVDPQPMAGTLDGTDRVCITDPSGELLLTDSFGTIDRWEYRSESSTTWTVINEETPDANYQFTGLTETTFYRVVVTNGACDEVVSNEWEVILDQEPIGGELAFEGFGSTIETCSNPGPDYNIPLNLLGQEGNIVQWRYKEGSATEWLTVDQNGEPFTGTTLSPDLIRSLGINQSTVFEVEVASGACTPNVFSQSATLGIVSSDIAPNPVTVTPGVVCIGDPVTLSGRTGYGTGPGMEAGAFDYSSITNKGWRITDSEGNYSNFDSSADNGVAAIWLRTNPLPLTTYNLNTGQIYTQNWDSSAGNEGNKGFAIVSGPNSSILETSIFNLFAVDSPILTFDQAFNLRPGSAIYVEISTDGGESYNTDNPLFSLVASNSEDGTSGYYESFGDDGPGDRTKNKLELDLSAYESFDNLRIRFRYEGKLAGDVWAVDAISLPVEPTNVDLTWTDYTDPDNPVIIGTNNSEQWTPTLIGWNDFEIRTKLTFDSTGEQCPVVENWKTISVFVFDQYTSTATAIAGSCGSNQVQLNGVIINSESAEVTEFPTRDRYTAQWEVISSPDGYILNEAHFTNDGSITPAIQDPNASFTPGTFGTYTLRWAVNRNVDDELSNDACPPIYKDITFDINDCTALDFDGVNDYVDLGSNYQGNYFIEAWILPFDREKADGTGTTNAADGTIISGPGFELTIAQLSGAINTGTRWYHIAVSNSGQLWVDGISSGSISLNGNGGNKTIIGAKWNPSEKTTENHFSGYIEEMRIWNTTLTEAQIRFMMNQRLINNGAQMGEQIPMDVPGGLTYDDLAGYYRLISADPEPLENSPVIFLQEDKPNNGLTPDRAPVKAPGRLVNMETNQQNTAPLPYYSANNGSWGNHATWLRPDVWDPPHTGSIEWNITRTSHNITSGSRDIKLLGLISEANTLDMEGTNPASWSGETGTGNELFISHYLLLNGIIDLNGESQLVQPMGSIVDGNSGGHLDRDQQGTMSSYNYNYWSSPVSPGSSNAGYSVAAVMMDGTNPGNPQGITFGSSYPHADGGPTSPRRVSEYWLHKFHGTANDYFQWKHIGSTGALNAGEGYSMKGTAGSAAIEDSQNYTFRGLPNNGDVIPGSTGPEENYLVGNPYPSAIDAEAFIADNLAAGHINGDNVFNGTIYFWSHFANKTHFLQQYIGGYAAYNLSGGVRAVAIDERINPTTQTGGEQPQQFIPVGQAFFINTMIDPNLAAAIEDAGLNVNVNGGQVIFKNSQRFFVPEDTGNGGSVFHSANKKTLNSGPNNSSTTESVEQRKIWLKFKSPKGYHRQILVTADERATDNFDLGFDAPLIDDNVEDMYWFFNNHQFVIQGVNDFNVDRKLKLGVKVAKKGEFIISIDQLSNVPANLPIFLKDNKEEVVHNLRESKYVTHSKPGVFTDRFEIVFKNETAVGIDPEPEEPIVSEEGPIEVIYINDTREVIIKNPELVKIDRVYLNNMAGQQVHVYYNVPQDKRVPLPVKRFSSGVYIVKLHSENGIISKKVILE